VLLVHVCRENLAYSRRIRSITINCLESKDVIYYT